MKQIKNTKKEQVKKKVKVKDKDEFGWFSKPTGKNTYNIDDFLDKQLGKVGTKKREENRKKADIQLKMDDIAMMRKESGLTQQQVAEKLGVDKGYISRLENGKISPNLKTFLNYVEAIGRRVEVL